MGTLSRTVRALAGSALLLTASAASAQMQNPATKGVTTPKPTRVGTKALTVKECTGLGGLVDNSSRACEAKGQFTCRTVDSKNVTRMVCIDKFGQ